MVGPISRRSVLRLSALATAGTASFAGSIASAGLAEGQGFNLFEPGDVGAGSSLITIAMTDSGAVAVADNEGQRTLRAFTAGLDPATFTQSGDLGALPNNFEPIGIAISGEFISVYGGEWITTPGEPFERGTGGVTIADFAASETLQTEASTVIPDVRRLQPVTYRYSTSSHDLTRIESPTIPGGQQAIFLETVLPGAASIIGVIDDEDTADVTFKLALWGLDGSLILGAQIGVASEISDVVLPIGSGSLFAFKESTDSNGVTTVTPTLLGLVPLPLTAQQGSLAAASRTATGSTAVIENETGALLRWAPLTGWTPVAMSLSSNEYLSGVGGGTADPLFAATTGSSSFRLLSI